MKVGPVHAAAIRPTTNERLEARNRDHDRKVDDDRAHERRVQSAPRQGTGKIVDRTA